MSIKIRICEGHPEYQVPLIGTYVFPVHEQWCPYCGYRGDMFGGQSVDATDELRRRRDEYEALSKPFLDSVADGKRINWDYLKEVPRRG